MSAYHIVGGTPLRGTVVIHGAKNSVLPILAATLVTGGKCVLHNCPNISDVDIALEILRCLGCQSERRGDTILVDTYSAKFTEIPAHLMKKMRAAVIFLGALLARFSEAHLYPPGGCCLGERPIDLHLHGLSRLGADCRMEGEALLCRAERLKGCTIALPFPSVGATENILLAALSAEGETVLCNAAREPEIGDLINFLRACGAEITENGSVLRVQGGKALHGAEYMVLPDRMEAATYLCAAAATRGEILLQRTNPAHYRAVTEGLRCGGCEVFEGTDTLFLSCKDLMAVSPIRTAPYDGFPTDAQAPFMAAMAAAQGVSVFEETVFSDRLRHVPAFLKMGARITTAGRCAIVTGAGNDLHGAAVAATDLRGGAAMVLLALAARGVSRITEISHIERGYEGFAEALRACGAEIERTEGQ